MSTPLFSNKLLLVPLFQGFSRLDFLDIVEKVPLDFHTYKAKEVVVKQNDECQSLCIVLGGKICVETENPEHTYLFQEELQAPVVVQIEHLFGLHNRYTRTIRAKEQVNVVRINKQDVRMLMTKYPTFQINFYNTLSSYAQRVSAQLWIQRKDTLEGRFRVFAQKRSLRPNGEKTIRIKMEDLAHELGATRLSVSNMLAQLNQKGLLTNSRGTIHIFKLEEL